MRYAFTWLKAVLPMVLGTIFAVSSGSCMGCGSQKMIQVSYATIQGDTIVATTDFIVVYKGLLPTGIRDNKHGCGVRRLDGGRVMDTGGASFCLGVSGSDGGGCMCSGRMEDGRRDFSYATYAGGTAMIYQNGQLILVKDEGRSVYVLGERFRIGSERIVIVVDDDTVTQMPQPEAVKYIKQLSRWVDRDGNLVVNPSPMVLYDASGPRRP